MKNIAKPIDQLKQKKEIRNKNFIVMYSKYLNKILTRTDDPFIREKYYQFIRD